MTMTSFNSLRVICRTLSVGLVLCWVPRHEDNTDHQTVLKTPERSELRGEMNTSTPKTENLSATTKGPQTTSPDLAVTYFMSAQTISSQEGSRARETRGIGQSRRVR